MSTSTWNDHPTPAQMSPHGSYQPNFDGEDDNYGRPGNPSDHYDPDDNGNKYESYHGSMKNYDHDHQQQQESPKHSSHHHDSNDAYSHHGMSDRGSVKGGYAGDGGSLKDFASDNGSGMRSKYGGGHGGGSERGGGSLKDGHGDMMKEHKFGGSEYGDGNGRGLPMTHNYESERESAGGMMSSMMDSWRPGMSWIDRRTFCMGDSCAAPPDWENHPILRQVPTQDHQAYRYYKIQLGSYNPTLKFQQTSEVAKVVGRYCQ
jgi:hypothetical protein